MFNPEKTVILFKGGETCRKISCITFKQICKTALLLSYTPRFTEADAAYSVLMVLRLCFCRRTPECLVLDVAAVYSMHF